MPFFLFQNRLFPSCRVVGSKKRNENQQSAVSLIGSEILTFQIAFLSGFPSRQKAGKTSFVSAARIIRFRRTHVFDAPHASFRAAARMSKPRFHASSALRRHVNRPQNATYSAFPYRLHAVNSSIRTVLGTAVVSKQGISASI